MSYAAPRLQSKVKRRKMRREGKKRESKIQKKRKINQKATYTEKVVIHWILAEHLVC